MDELTTYRVYDVNQKVIATIRDARMVFDQGTLLFYDKGKKMCAAIKIWAMVVVLSTLSEEDVDRMVDPEDDD